MESLTDIQKAVYDYTRQVLKLGQPFPSLRDIASHFGFQHTTARFHLKALEKKGFIKQRAQRISDYMLADDRDIDFQAQAQSFDLIARISESPPDSPHDRCVRLPRCARFVEAQLAQGLRESEW